MLWLQLTIYAIIALTVLYPVVRKSYFSSSLVLGNLVIFLLLFLLSILPLDLPTVAALSETVSTQLIFRPTDLQTFRFQTIISSMFLHGSLLHIMGNVIFLYLLGLPLEERIGSPAFGFIYFTTGIAATLIYGLINWGDTRGALGASGAIMGIAGAFVALYPRDRIFMLLGFIILPRVPVNLAVGVVVAYQFILLFLGVDGIAIEAHLGGIVSGGIIAPLVLRTKIEARIKARGVSRLALDDLAVTEELRELLEVIRKESMTEVREAWVDHFLKKAHCPQCKGTLSREGNVVKSDCGWSRSL